MKMEELYNYDSFVEEKAERWMKFDESPRLGEPAPDFSLTSLEGEQKKLSDIWKSASFTVMEFGSFT